MLVASGFLISKVINVQNQTVASNEKSEVASQNDSNSISKPPLLTTPPPSSTVKSKNPNVTKEVSSENANSLSGNKTAVSTPATKRPEISRVIGAWKDQNNKSVEFLDDGTAIIEQSGGFPPLTAKYKFLNDGRILIEASIFGISTGDTARVEFVENTMILTSKKERTVLTRVR